eukprot:TRINITY_DN67277_c10_g1_i1.p1 TRINITY_DN67277_c10_g1~~TRINITY_DN67277_c10_g1_i1.p1  ORF type:complete len:176 (-),score=18.47 TRINITY_DN67277_c10_g1_i1:19-468(-)
MTAKLYEQYLNTTYEFFQTDGTQTLAQQATLWRSFGVVMTTHGGQEAMFGYFAHENAVLIELSSINLPERRLYKNLTAMMGQTYMYSCCHRCIPANGMWRACPPHPKSSAELRVWMEQDLWVKEPFVKKHLIKVKQMFDNCTATFEDQS